MNVPYPTDGMTWEDITVLAENVSNPKKWSALDIADYDLAASQLSLRLFDPETERVDYELDAWTEMEHFVKKLNSLQSEEKRDGKSPKNSSMSAFASGRTAMVAGSLYDDTQLKQGFYDQESNLTMNHVEWDAVSYPVFSDEKLLAPAKQTLYIGVPGAAMNKEEAYKVMIYLLSEEVQADNMRKGLASLRTDSVSIVDQFGESSSLLSGKSTASFFKTTTQAGAFEPSLDDYFGMGQRLEEVVSSSTFLADQTLQGAKENLRSEISDYWNKRSRFIEEMRSKTSKME
ncbi:hypothetical protein J2T14_005372 [Paenibacillus harenae]|nr:hypothetical protein [Paenibacillus harenae]